MDAAVHRLPEGPRRRGAAVAGQRRRGRPWKNRPLYDRLRGGVDAARLLLDKVRRRSMRRLSSTPLFIGRLREGPRRRGAAVAGQRRGGRPKERTASTPLLDASRLPEGRTRSTRAAVAGERRGGDPGRNIKDDGDGSLLYNGRLPNGHVDSGAAVARKGAEVDIRRRCHRLRERPRRRCAAAAGQRRGGRSGGRKDGLYGGSPARTATSTRRRCWTSPARRATSTSARGCC